MTSSLNETLAAAAAHAAAQAEQDALEKAEEDARWLDVKLAALREAIPQAQELVAATTGRTDLELITTPEEAVIGWDGWSATDFKLHFSAPEGLTYRATGHTWVAGERVRFTLALLHTSDTGAKFSHDFWDAASHVEALQALLTATKTETATAAPSPQVSRRKWWFGKS